MPITSQIRLQQLTGSFGNATSKNSPGMIRTDSTPKILAAVGGFEIATMVGALLQAASERRVVVVDGFIATAAVLVAHVMCPKVLAYCVFAHQSGEQGHRKMLKFLNAQPLLDLGLRLSFSSSLI